MDRKCNSIMKRLLTVVLILVSITMYSQWRPATPIDVKSNGNYSNIKLTASDTCTGSINVYNNGFDGIDISAGNCYSGGAWQYTTPHAALCLFFNLQDSTLEFWSETAGGVGNNVSWSSRKMWIDFDGGIHTSKTFTDSIMIDNDTISNLVYTDSITTDLGNVTTGVPKTCTDTLYQNGTATVSIAVELADDETYNLPDAKEVDGKVRTGANYCLFFTETSGAVTLPVSSGSTANTDSDGTTICIYDGGTRGVIKNRSGGALTFIISYTWEY